MDFPAIDTRLKVLFWIILSCLSVIFAEVSCYSSPFPFTSGWGLGVVLPLYGLHTLVLGTIVLRAKKPTMQVLFTAGMLFGLYEALITKVLWNPTWGLAEPMIAGVAGVQTAVLVFFWHPWFAFIVPLLFGEMVCSNSSVIMQAFPNWIQRLCNYRFWKYGLFSLLAFYLGLTEGINTLSIGSTLFSVLQAFVVFSLLLLVWKRVTKNQSVGLCQLMPDRREITILAVLLGLFYIVSFVFIRPEAIPKTLIPYLTISVLYLVSIFLLVRNTRNSPNPGIPLPTKPRRWWFIEILGFSVIFTMSSLIWMNAKPMAQQIVLYSWIAGVITGMWILVTAISKALQKSRREDLSGQIIDGSNR